MRNPVFFHLLVLGFCLNISCQAQNSSEKQDAVYSFKTPGSGGTGKVYMGREIAHVMDFQGKDWLERQSREQEENTMLAIEKLPVTDNSVVADIGAGSGFYTFRIAPKVPQGKVYAVEIQDDAIQYLQNRSKELGFDQVIPVKGKVDSPNLPANSIDLAIMVDVYHELEFPVEMLAEIRKSLKPEGKLLLIEYRGEDPAVAIRALHKMTVPQIEKELTANGFILVENGQFMRIQHFLVFERAK
ncbi:class I SAM-dependent methyltransferase [Algoriphagus sp. A40]|uniref:class I SAM-dependent methyltransferase n=1 Tax=Algoriphagus sp. A40 TaxID=1945863 RepID=UPI0009840A6D|nr:class I SAM-dependent methyltransferase [Algoriphagus sp. A40]OOG77640.1 SAM-dependent methyltransferase [Algoriphagus sp. A40]